MSLAISFHSHAIGVANWTLAKTANPTTYTAAGQVINYTYVVTNQSGFSNGTLVGITDDKIATVNCPNTHMVLGGTLTCTGSYTTTVADVTSGSVTNHATANGDACGDGCTVAAPAQATVSLAAIPTWTLAKTANPTTYTAAGQVVNYSYLLTNTGTVTINTITISDNKIAVVTCPVSTLAGGANTTCTGSYTTTAADVTSGSVVNSATASGTPTAGTLAPATAQATITFTALPAWTLAKTANPTAYTAAGQVVSYSYLLTNTGNVTINAITIGDNKVAVVTCPVTTLAVDAHTTCTGNYTTTAADVTSGSVVNSATASGTPASGILLPATAQATITLTALPSWTITNTPNPTTYTGAGQMVNYTYLLTNTGNVPISSIVVSDTLPAVGGLPNTIRKLGLAICPAGTLAPGANMTCTGTYTTTAQDVINRSYVNSVSAHGSPVGSLLPVTAQSTINLLAGAVTIAKTTTGGDGTFSYTGSLVTANPAFVSITTAGGAGSPAPATLVPGTYTITENPAAGFNFLSVVCTGDNNGSVNQATRTATINLDSGENVVCTFSSALQAQVIVAQSVPALSRYGLALAILVLMAGGIFALRRQER